MQSPKIVRTVESTDCSMMVELTENGNFIVRLQSGAVSIRIGISAESAEYLFSHEKSAATAIAALRPSTPASEVA